MTSPHLNSVTTRDDEPIQVVDNVLRDDDIAVLEENHGNTDSEAPAPQRQRQAVSDHPQPVHRVPVKLREGVEPEKMVDKILNQNLDRIAVREVLGLSPDLLQELWGVKGLPAIKATIPTVWIEDRQIVERSVRFANRIEGIGKHLYACVSPTVTGCIEGTQKVKMLIDSDLQMYAMSKTFWQELEDHLLIDCEIRWSIGSADATLDLVYGVRHSVAIDIGGIQIRFPIFVLNVAAKDLILGRLWERKARAQYDNLDDGSLYITISALDGQREAPFCAVVATNARNRD
jgi:hypothetical protein